jgi:hypothetical protein
MGILLSCILKIRNLAVHLCMAMPKDFASAPTVGVRQVVNRCNSLSYYYSFARLEFNDPILGVNLEYSSAIPAIVRHPVTILGLMEGKHISYASWVVLDGQRSKFSFKTAVS